MWLYWKRITQPTKIHLSAFRSWAFRHFYLVSHRFSCQLRQTLNIKHKVEIEYALENPCSTVVATFTGSLPHLTIVHSPPADIFLLSFLSKVSQQDNLFCFSTDCLSYQFPLRHPFFKFIINQQKTRLHDNYQGKKWTRPSFSNVLKNWDWDPKLIFLHDVSQQKFNAFPYNGTKL